MFALVFDQLADGPWEDNLYIQGLLRTTEERMERFREHMIHSLAYQVKREHGERLKVHLVLQKFLKFWTSAQMKSAKWIYTAGTKERFSVIFLWVKHQRFNAFEMYL